jgi:protein tyrosine/serine phosphatase
MISSSKGTNPADEILPGIWLGSRYAATDGNWLLSHRIKSVFNCTKDIPFHHIVSRKYRIPVDDNLEAREIRNLELWSYEIIYKILNEYKQGEPILIHCAAGIQRSAATVAMVLIVLRNMNAEEAIRFIQSKRSVAFRPAVNFRNAIDGFYKSYKKLLVNYN